MADQPRTTNAVPIVNWYVADSAELAALTLTRADIGKVAQRIDTGQMYVLQWHSPATWVELMEQRAGLIPTVASLTFANGQQLVALTTAITANSTTTALPAGSLAITSHATGVGKLFASDGTKWQFAGVA